VLHIIGRALPEDAHAFFLSIAECGLVNYSSLRQPSKTVVDLKIDYFNSAATRYIFNISDGLWRTWRAIGQWL
jgi:hypothetical protein